MHPLSLLTALCLLISRCRAADQQFSDAILYAEVMEKTERPDDLDILIHDVRNVLDKTLPSLNNLNFICDGVFYHEEGRRRYFFTQDLKYRKNMNVDGKFDLLFMILWIGEEG